MSTRLVFIFTVTVLLSGLSGRTQANPADSSRTAADSLSAPGDLYFSVRGLEKDEQLPGTTWRRIVNTVFWLPRNTIDLLLTSAAFGAVLVDEKRIINKFERVFYLYERKLSWFPLFNVVTGNPRGYGLSLSYEDNYFTTAFRGAYSNSDIWGVKSEVSYIFFGYKYYWKIILAGRLENDDNFRFYGVGPHPKDDSRSFFRPETEEAFGIYAQRRSLLEITIGLRPSADWEFFLSSFYQRRSVSDPAGSASDNFSRVFNIERLPGFREDSRKWYSEISFRLDNRDNLDLIEPGIRVDGHTGISIGIGEDNNRLLRAGLDASAFIAVKHRNRILIPRLIFDIAETLDGSTEIPLTAYPRHPAFRGVGRKELIRNDRRSLISSLEYIWPLTYNLSAHFFADHLMVAPEIAKFTFSNAPWAVGVGADFHTARSEIGRGYITYGSEGIRVHAILGISSLFRDRSDWK